MIWEEEVDIDPIIKRDVKLTPSGTLALRTKENLRNCMTELAITCKYYVVMMPLKFRIDVLSLKVFIFTSICTHNI